MKSTTNDILEELIEKYPSLEVVKQDILKAFIITLNTYQNGGKLFACGNGGSAADSEHIVGELMKSFKKPRSIDDNVKQKLISLGDNGKYIAENLEGALPAISLTSHISLTTAYMNDREPNMTFAQQLLGLGVKGDVLVAISTSGNSKNCVYASTLAKAMGIYVIGMTGSKDNKMKEVSDVCICVPETETYKVQELHLPVYHALCAMIEEELFG